MKGSRDQTLNNQPLCARAAIRLYVALNHMRSTNSAARVGWLVRTAVAGQFLTTPTNSH